jgi:hypothetical protein
MQALYFHLTQALQLPRESESKACTIQLQEPKVSPRDVRSAAQVNTRVAASHVPLSSMILFSPCLRMRKIRRLPFGVR